MRVKYKLFSCVLKTSRLCCSWLSFEHLAEWEDVAIITSNTIAWLREKSLYAWDCPIKCSIISCVLLFHDFIVASSWERKVGDVSKWPKLLDGYSWVNEDLVLCRSQMCCFGLCSLVWISLFLYLNLLSVWCLALLIATCIAYLACFRSWAWAIVC